MHEHHPGSSLNNNLRDISKDLGSPNVELGQEFCNLTSFPGNSTADRVWSAHQFEKQRTKQPVRISQGAGVVAER